MFVNPDKNVCSFFFLALLILQAFKTSRGIKRPAPVPGKPISANQGLNLDNPGFKFCDIVSLVE